MFSATAKQLCLNSQEDLTEEQRQCKRKGIMRLKDNILNEALTVSKRGQTVWGGEEMSIHVVNIIILEFLTAVSLNFSEVYHTVNNFIHIFWLWHGISRCPIHLVKHKT